MVDTRVVSKSLVVTARKRRMRTIVPWGDSITASGNAFIGQVNPTTAGVATEYVSGYAETLIRGSGRWSELNNAGFAGQTLAQIAARYAVDVQAYNPDAVLIMGGTNDMVSGMSNAAMKTALQTLEGMVKTVLLDGRLPILVTIPPKNNAALEARVFNSFLYDMADFYGIPLIDLHRILVDAQTGNYASSTTYSADGIHPNDAAVTLIAAQFAAVLKAIESYITPNYMDPVANNVVNGSLTNLLRNGNFALSSAPPAPDFWTMNNTGATQTANAMGPGVAYPYTGNEHQYVKASGAAAFALSGGPPVIVPGNKMRFSGSLGISGQVPASATGVRLEGAFGAGQVRPFQSFKQNGDFDFAMDFVVPAGQTAFTPRLYVTDFATYKVRNLTLIDLTARAAVYTPGQV